MPKTYDYLPYDIAELLRSIVATVNDNLKTEPSLTIPRVSYKAETWNELCNRLKADSEGKNSESRYPMVALIRNYEYDNGSDDPWVDTSLTIVIVTQTTSTMLSEQRQIQNYQPVLYPIYTELMEQIAFSRFFQGPYNPYPAHKMIESFNLSKSESGIDKALQLPEFVDGIIISNMRLRVNRPRVAAFTYGATKQLSYLNNVAKLTCQTGVRQLTVNFEQMNYINTALGAPTPTYAIYFSHDGSFDNHFGPSRSLSKSFEAETGDFYGYIQCSDGLTISTLWFYYSLNVGNVVKYTPSSQFKLAQFNLNGFDYPDYPFNAVMQTTANKPIIQGRSISSDGGNVYEEKVYTPSVNDTQEVTTSLSFPVPTYYRDIGYQVAIDGLHNTTVLLENFSYYKLQ